MATPDLALDQIHQGERFHFGTIPVNSTPLLGFVGVAVTGIYVVSFTAVLGSQTTILTTLTEFTVTAAGDELVVDAGDLFIPFNPDLGTDAGDLNAGLAMVPAVSVTDHKLPILINNSTAGGLDPNNDLTVTGLLIKLTQ